MYSRAHEPFQLTLRCVLPKLMVSDASSDVLSRLLAQTPDDACFVVDVARFEQNAKAFLTSFQALYPRTRLGYSYKTNPLPRLCTSAHAMGCYAEVVSGHEYRLARALGVPGTDILFNGPVKTAADLRLALQDEARVHIDNLDELDTLSAALERRPQMKVALGLRCSLELMVRGLPSRFGLSAATGDLYRAAELIRRHPQTRLAGLHSHFSYDRSAASYRQRTEQMIALADELFPEQEPEFIDVGGGFCGAMPPSLRDQLGYTPPTLEAYAESIAGCMADRYRTGRKPELILEPGVGVLADVMQYVCRVTAVKSLPDRQIAITSGTVDHLKIVPNQVDPPLTVVRDGPEPEASGSACTTIVGYTCLEHDILTHRHAGNLQTGDILVYDNVGAYTFSTTSPFIRLPPPVMERGPDDSWITRSASPDFQSHLASFTW